MMRQSYLKFFSRHFLRHSITTNFRVRNLLLISLDWKNPKDTSMALGHASLLATLREKNIPVIEKSFAVNKSEFSTDTVVNFILEHAKDNTDLAMGAFVWNEDSLQTILNRIRSKFKGRIILGGPQVSYVKRNVENYYPLVDVFIRGYAETALARLMASKIEKPIITGVHYANEPDLGLSAKTDLDDIPSPFLTETVKPESFIRWETQRGCPFRCSFCQHRESDSSQQRRHFNESRIMKEIKWITEHPVIQDIAVLDPTFNSGPNYLNVLSEFHRRNYQGKLSLQTRMEMVTPEFLNIVEKLNQKGRTVLEFGLQTIHKNEQKLIDRPTNISKVNEVLKEVKKRNIPTEVSLIFGLPLQTVNSFQASIDFCKQHGVKTIYAFPLMLLRGTPLFDNKEKFNLIESSDIQIDGIGIDRIQKGIPHVVASSTFNFSEWQQMAEMARLLDEYNRKMATLDNRHSSDKMANTLKYSLWGADNEALKRATESRQLTAPQKRGPA